MEGVALAFMLLDVPSKTTAYDPKAICFLLKLGFPLPSTMLAGLRCSLAPVSDGN